MNKISFAYSALVCLITLVLVSASNAQNFLEKHSATVTPYVTSDVVGVAYVDLASFDFDNTMDVLTKIGAGSGDKFEDIKENATAIKAELKRLKEAGLSSAFGIVRMSDVQSGGTSWVLPVTKGSDARVVAETLSEHPLIKQSNQMVEAGAGVVFIAGSQTQIETLKTERADQPRDLSEQWKAMGGGTAGLVLFGDSDSRRVVKELMPAMPAPFEALTGSMIADDIQWAGISIYLSKSFGASVEIESSNEESAKTIESVVQAGTKLLQTMPQLDIVDKSELGFLVESIAPVRSGTRVSISTDKLMKDTDRFAKALSPMVNKLKSAADRSSRLNKLGQLALAMHNYESAHRHFPTQAIVDKAGKPLLSWRVQILPFIEQGDLYNQFKLDEPWDSEHNLKLVKQMPETFFDSNRENNKAGKTIFQVPSGKGLLFDGANEITFSKITDGSSNTLLAICVADKHAAVWTKPDDWQVDFADVTAELKQDGRKYVEAALADGSVHRIFIDAAVEKWEPLLKYADGGIVTVDDFEP